MLLVVAVTVRYFWTVAKHFAVVLDPTCMSACRLLDWEGLLSVHGLLPASAPSLLYCLGICICFALADRCCAYQLEVVLLALCADMHPGMRC
jgi:hypothetical protein